MRPPPGNAKRPPMVSRAGVSRALGGAGGDQKDTALAQLECAAAVLAARSLGLDERLWRSTDQAELDAVLAGLIDQARAALEVAA